MIDQSGSLANFETIQILLAEYSSLRAELVERTSMTLQIPTIGFAGLGVVFLLNSGYAQKFLFLLGLSIVIAASWFNYRDVTKLSGRVKELEQAINNRAGEPLLEWETRYGSGSTGWFGLARPLPRQPSPAPSENAN